MKISFRSAVQIIPLFLGTLAVAAPQGFGLCRKHLPDGIKIGETSNITIVSGGLTRSYLITLPPLYFEQPESPVILSYHGGTQTSAQQQTLSQFSNSYFNDIAIAVYPQGINDTWQGIPGLSPTINDIQFTNDILNQLEELYCVDTTRIWANGKSDGGGFTNTLACDGQMSKRIAAFAPVSGAYYVNTLPCEPDTVAIPCTPARQVPIIDFHGEADPIINYEGGERKNECLPSIPHFIQEWALRDGLSLNNISIPFTTNTTIFSYGFGFEYGLVQEVSTIGNGHTWPATFPNEDNQVKGQHVALFNATSIIMDFFKKNPLPQGFF